MELEYLCGNQKGDERELSRMSDKTDLVNGRFSVSAKTQDSGLWRRTPCLTSRLLKQRTGQKIHDKEVTGQTARRAVDVHTNCVRSTTTSKSADPVVNRITADEVTGSDPVISSDMTVELQPLSTQMGYMLVVSLNDQAQERVRNSLACNGAASSQLHYALVTMFEEQAPEIMRSPPEGMAAEEWRKLV